MVDKRLCLIHGEADHQYAMYSDETSKTRHSPLFIAYRGSASPCISSSNRMISSVNCSNQNIKFVRKTISKNEVNKIILSLKTNF